MLDDVRAIYRQSKKPVDDFWTEWVSRPPAALLVYWLKGTALTPNQVTILSLATAAAAAAAFVALPGWLGLVLAGLLYQLSYVLDCADGQLARMRGTTSPLGADLDFLMDELKALLVLGAVSVRLWLERGDRRYLLLGVIGLVMLASNLSLTKFMRGPSFPAPPPRDEGRSPKGGPVAVAAWVGKWLIQYPRYLLIVCLLGRVEIFFFAYLAANALLLLRSLLRMVSVVAR